MSKFMISGIYLRCLLERRGEQLLEHTALGPGMELLFDEEMSSSCRHSLLVASPLLSLLPPAQHHQQRGQREGEREHGQTNLRRNIVLADIGKISCLGSVLSILCASF